MLKPLNSFFTVNVQPLFSVLNLQPLMGAQNLDLLWKEPLGMFFSFLYPYIMVASRGKGGPGMEKRNGESSATIFGDFVFMGFGRNRFPGRMR